MSLQNTDNLPLITVLIPCYNAMPYLPLALDSLIHQSYTHLEILCINDGSTDQTGEVLEQYAQRDNRIRVVHNETNIKLIATLNKGIKLASGEYIARMDADDISFLNRISVQYQFLARNPHVDLISTVTVNINEKGDVLNHNLVRSTHHISTLYASFFFQPIGHPDIMCKTSLLKNNLFSTDVSAIHTEDYELWCRLLHQGYVLQNIQLPLLYYRIHPKSVSRKFTGEQDNHYIQIANAYYAQYFKNHIPITYSKVLANRIDQSVSWRTFIIAFSYLAQTERQFLSQNPEQAPNVVREIRMITKTHRMDILIQSIKRGRLLIKLTSCFGLWLSVCDLLLYKEVRKYFFNKLR
ncbi:MAG: glycosyltransferase family 2 protein [Candidatus Competibacteraceae bacterium]|nr:glycosyltransferase family 2 protein [Candidatus Competibacteraceae bacterium]